MHKGWVDEGEIKRLMLDLMEDEAIDFLSKWSNASIRTAKTSSAMRKKPKADDPCNLVSWVPSILTAMPSGS
eukprot:765351-Hanusia_phi.AAC.3